MEVIAKFDYKLRVTRDCVIMSRVNHPCSFSGHGGMLWRNVFFLIFFDGWKAVIMLPLLVRSCHVSFIFIFDNPCWCYGKQLCSISPVVTQLKNLCITQSGTLLNSTVLITLISSFCIKEHVLYTSQEPVCSTHCQ